MKLQSKTHVIFVCASRALCAVPTPMHNFILIDAISHNKESPQGFLKLVTETKRCLNNVWRMPMVVNPLESLICPVYCRVCGATLNVHAVRQCTIEFFARWLVLTFTISHLKSLVSGVPSYIHSSVLSLLSQPNTNEVDFQSSTPRPYHVVGTLVAILYTYRMVLL